MTATSVSLPTDRARTPSILLEADHDRAHEGSPALHTDAIRADLTDARWSVRVVLAEADDLAGALIAALTGDAAASIAALTPGDTAPGRVRLMTRGEREQQQLLRRIEWDE